MKGRLLVGVILTAGLFSSPLRAAELPSETGQSAFAAISEVASGLLEDETTDWSRVSLLALREHLVDMNEVLMRAAVAEEPTSGGVVIRATGEGRTLEALRRMIPMHSRMIQGHDGWRVVIEELPDGYRVEVTAEDPAVAERLRGLGFFGFLAAGDHHRRHHLHIATGAMMH